MYNAEFALFFEPPHFISHLVIGDLLDSNLRFVSSIKHVSIAIGTAGHQIVWNENISGHSC